MTQPYRESRLETKCKCGGVDNTHPKDEISTNASNEEMHKAFQRAIAESQSEPVHHFAYADWLEEQGDSKAAREHRAAGLASQAHIHALQARDKQSKRNIKEGHEGEFKSWVGKYSSTDLANYPSSRYHRYAASAHANAAEHHERLATYVNTPTEAKEHHLEAARIHRQLEQEYAALTQESSTTNNVKKEDFEYAIHREPLEPTHHFAYADWLEEHNEPRVARAYRASGMAVRANNLAHKAYEAYHNTLQDREDHSFHARFRSGEARHLSERAAWKGNNYNNQAWHREASMWHEHAATAHERAAQIRREEGVSEQPKAKEAILLHQEAAKIHRRLENEHKQLAQDSTTSNVTHNVSKEDFERAIREEPHEPTHYLAYADWLEEHGDEKGAQSQRIVGLATQATEHARAAHMETPVRRNRHSSRAHGASEYAQHASLTATSTGDRNWHYQASHDHGEASFHHAQAAQHESKVSDRARATYAIQQHEEAGKIHRQLRDMHERLAESTPSRTENNTMPTPLNPCGIEVVNESVVNNNTTSNTHYGAHHPWGAGEQTNEDTYDNEVSPNDEAEYLSQHAGDVSDWANKVGTAKAHQLASGAHRLASEAHEELAGSTSSSASIYHHNLAKIHEGLATQAMIAGSPLGVEDVTPNPYGPQDLGGYDRRLADVHRIEGEPHIPGTVNRAGPKPGLRKRPRRRKPNIGVSVEPTLKGFEEAPLIEGTRNASSITNADRTYHANLYHPGEEVRVHAPHARSGEVGKVLSHDRKSGDVNVDFDGEPDVVSEDHLTHNGLSSNAATFLEKAVEAAQQARDAASVPMIHEETKRSYYQPAAATESAWLATKRAEKNPTKNKQVLAGKMHEKAASVHSARAKALEAKSGLSDEQQSHIYYHRLAAQHHITAAREHFKSLSQSVHNSIPHWTRVAREAAKDAKTAQLLTGKGGKESAAAMKASTKAWIARTEEAHHAALNEHKKASEAHEKAAAESSEPSHKEAHANAALAHWDAAIAHRKEMLAKGKEKVHNTSSLQRLAEEAAIATAKAHDYTRQVGGATNHAVNAQEASNKAYRAAEGGDEGGKEAKKHHYKAAMSHRKAATLHGDIGRRTKVEQEQLAHFQAVRAHKEALQAHMRAFRHEQGTNNTTTNNVSKELETASAAALSHSEGAIGAALHYGLKGPVDKAAYKAGVFSDRAYSNPTTKNHIRALKAHINASINYAKGASLATNPELKKIYSYLSEQHGHAARFHDEARILTQSQKRSNESLGRWQAVHGKNPFSANQSFQESYPADKTAILGKQMLAFYKTRAPKALASGTPEKMAFLLHKTAVNASNKVRKSNNPKAHKEAADVHNAAAVHYHALADTMRGSPLGNAYRAVAQSHRTAGVWHTFKGRDLAGQQPTKVANQSSPANDIVSSNGEQEYGVEDYLPQRQLSERDRRLGMLAKYELEELGNNPASWVKDEGKWEKAKAAASQQYKKSSKAFWPVVVSIYEKMGGKVRKHDKTENAVHAVYKFPPDQVRFFGNALRGHYEKKAPEALTEGTPEHTALSSHYKAVRATNEAHKLDSAASHEAAAMSNAHASMNYADLASQTKNQLLKNAYTGLAYAHRRAANYHTLSSRIAGSTHNAAENWTGLSKDAVTATRRAHYLTLKSLGIKPRQKVDVIDSPLFHSLEANRAASPYRQDVPTATLHKDAFESHREAARAHEAEAAKGGSNSKIHEAAMWGHVSAARAHRKALASLGDSEGSVEPKAGDLIKYRNPSLGERTGKIVAIDRKNDFALVRDDEGGQYSKIKRFSSAVKNHKVTVNAGSLPYGVTPPEHPALTTVNLVGQKFKPILKGHLGERSPEYKEAFGKHLAATFASHLASKQNTPEAHLEAARKNNEAHNAFQSLKSVAPHLDQGLNAMAMAHKKLAAVHLPLAGVATKPTGNIALPGTSRGQQDPGKEAKDISKTSQSLSQEAKSATRTAVEAKRLKGSIGQNPITYTRRASGLASHAHEKSNEGRWGSAVEGHSNAADAHFDAHNSLLKAWKHSGDEAYKKAADIHEKAAFSHLEAMHYIRRNMLALEGLYAKTNPKGTRNSAADIHQIPRRRKTNLLTSKATEMSLAAKDEDTHKSAHKAHKEAAKAHREAAEEIRKSPDHLMGEDYAMANHHEHMATWHDAKSVEHGVKGSVKV